MNLLLLEPEEIKADGTVCLEGIRATHLREVLKVAAGDVVRIGMVNGRLGIGTILSESPLCLCCDWQEPPPKPVVDLLVAMPRPKVMKRLWPVLSSLGVGRIWIVEARKTERFYFDSHVLDPTFIRQGLLEGLVQAKDTWLPEIHIHHRIDRFFADGILPLAEYGIRLLAHPDEQAPDIRRFFPIQTDGRVLLAVGPEGGWTAKEVALFGANGFSPVTWGNGRTLRTDVACIALLSALVAASAD